MLNVKQIVHYQVRQKTITLFIYLFNNGRENMKNKDRNTEFMSNFFSNKRK